MEGPGTSSRAPASSRARPSGRAGAGDSFFSELKDWSEIKLRILEKYVDAYRRKRGRWNPWLYYVDGFAGAGRYGKPPDMEEGSPLRLARLAQQIAGEGKNYRLVCLNTELDPARFNELRSCLESFDPTIVQAWEGAFATHLPRILTLTRGAPALFFLDPFGVKPITMDQLRPVLTRPDTELLLNLNTRALKRLAGFGASAARESEAKVRLVSQVFGVDPSDPVPVWLAAWRELRDPLAWERWAATWYQERLLAEAPHLQFAVAHPVRDRFRANPKYFLVFATRHYDAIPIMNDLICREEDDLFDRTAAFGANGQMSLEAVLRPVEQDDRLARLKQEILEYGSQHQGLNREQMLRHFVLRDFGELKRKHYFRAIDALCQEGRARYENGRPRNEARISFA